MINGGTKNLACGIALKKKKGCHSHGTFSQVCIFINSYGEVKGKGGEAPQDSVAKTKNSVANVVFNAYASSRHLSGNTIPPLHSCH
jgi:hypothetical protein